MGWWTSRCRCWLSACNIRMNRSSTCIMLPFSNFLHDLVLGWPRQTLLITSPGRSRIITGYSRRANVFGCAHARRMTMKYRQLGANGPTIPVIMLGAWPLGGGMGAVDKSRAIATVRRSIDLGINAIDTAEMY